jgi:dipicolinate synthase subunit B
MKLGFAICGSFCNHARVMEEYERLAAKHELIPILTDNAAGCDTRFGSAERFVERLETLAGRRAVTSIVEAEPLGPTNAMDALTVAPCTGNTLAKLAAGVTDNAVTMAVKSHLRNGKPVVLALATNDGLAASAVNIGALLNRKHYYFVPFGQDDPARKPTSLVADFSRLEETVAAALAGRQLQPILL